MDQRQHFLDWVRVLAFCILIFYHCAMFFVSWEWHVKNNTISDAFIPVMQAVNPWRLSLLFFISGVGVSFTLKNKSIAGFMVERTKRLLLPLVFGMLVIIPPQIYFEKLQNGSIQGNYLSFYSSVFDFIPYPAGSISWHHLWFVAYLWVFSMVAAPLFYWLKKKNYIYINTSAGLANVMKLLLMFFPAAIIYFLLRHAHPTTNNLVADWFNVAFSLLFFIFGYFLGTQKPIWDIARQYRSVFLAIGLLSLFLIPAGNYILQSILWPLGIWAMIVAICGYAKQHLNFSNSYITYANRAIFPFYILHQTIIVAVGYYIAGWQAAILIKYLLLLICSFGISLMLYHFIIVKFNITKALFGVK